MFGFVICFYVCILLLVNCVDLLPIQCIISWPTFGAYVSPQCVAGVLWSPTLGAVKRDRWSLTTVVTSRLAGVSLWAV